MAGPEWGSALGVDDEVAGWLGALWGKSAKRAGGRCNLLLSHLLDTAAVAELIWDEYLSVSTRRVLDEVAGGPGAGRRLFAWLCGVHDCGKATPAFQHLDADGARATQRAGLGWDAHLVKRAPWRHDKAGGRLVRRFLAEEGWPEEQIDWVWPLVAGHHGTFPSLGQLTEPKQARGHLQGKGPEWLRAQDSVVTVFTRLLGFRDLAAVQPRVVPSRAVQLQLSGFVVMADWIASDQRHFLGIDSLDQVGMGTARDRADAAWAAQDLRGGWGTLPLPGCGVFQERFGQDPRPSQVLVLDVVRRMAGPGLVVIEAPMGEGKTKTALAAAEILAARFGADGVFVGMPTQATSDPMFSNVRRWLARVSAGLESQVALLHGKRMFNKEWRALLEAAGEHPDDFFDGIEEDDLYGLGALRSGGGGCPERKAPAEWFLGRLRGLLSPFAVGTIDQLLFAATRTKHVMLRMAGLLGKVVVLDEVHAADVYMSQFLHEGLRWLGEAGVPVVLLSATLPPAQRRALVAAYLAGAASVEQVDTTAMPEPGGYPSVTAAWLGTGGAEYVVEDAASWREDLQVRVAVLPERTWREPDTEGEVSPGDAAVTELLEQRLQDGGCALVIRNTVDRAQGTYAALKAVFGGDVRLLHGRLHAEHRAERTEECLGLLGPPSKNGPPRPDRLILVATQLAEQSFDVDADLLVTDLAPVDLLLQRIGRLHRHDGVGRPGLVSAPEVFVTGFAPVSEGVPSVLRASEGIYGRYLLLRTAALVIDADGDTWSVPGEVPHLVAQVYGEEHRIVPDEAWTAAEQEAFQDWCVKQQRRADNAEPYLLTRRGEHSAKTLEGLHYGAAPGTLHEEQFQALVRDGDRSVEVVMVRRDDRGYRTLGGRWLGVNGEASPDLVEEVLAATVRLPPKLTADAEHELAPLDGWRNHPWLRYSRALVLDEVGSTSLGPQRIRYDEELGLVVSKDSPRPGEVGPTARRP
jgi:CRISPR-associated endonuclease/helicase Cas3